MSISGVKPSKSWYCDGFSIVKRRDIDDAPNRDVNHLDTDTRSVLMSTDDIVYDVIGEAAVALSLSAHGMHEWRACPKM
jgi:hypothetical protein